jgi:hypothetical protein
MSAREQLQREAALLPEGVAQGVLDYLHHLPVRDAAPPAIPPTADYFEAYWSHWYGKCEGQTWDEPAELPQETRETW